MSTIFINVRDSYPSVIALTNDLTSDQWPLCSRLLSEYKKIGDSKDLSDSDKLKHLEKIMNNLIKDGHEIKEW